MQLAQVSVGYDEEYRGDLESLALAKGRERFEKAQGNIERNEGAAASYGASKLIRGSIPLVAKVLSSTLDAAIGARGQGKGKAPQWLKVLREFDADTLAYMALSGVYDGIARETNITKTSTKIGRTIEAECVAKAMLEQLGTKATARVQGVLNRQGSAKMREKVFSKLVKANEVTFPGDHEEWEDDIQMKLGEPLMNAVLLALPDLFELANRTVAKRTQTYIQLTPEGSKLVTELTEAASWMRPLHQPMVTPPRPWEAFDTGCYYDERVARTVKLVRTFNKDHKALIKAAITDGSMAFCLESLNAVQAVPWSINQQILGVLKWAWEEKVVIDGFPRSEPLPVPGRISDADWDGMNDQQRKGHRLAISATLTRNRSTVSDCAVMLRDLSTAEGLALYDRFYLPHNLDFRGRVYPVCHFNNQRGDHIKALFRFADGCALGEAGGDWLAIHLANCWDGPDKLSKQPFADRTAWVADNTDMLIAIGHDPCGMFATWSQADQPFMFLAAAIEFAQWSDSGWSEDFISYIPVALDGSNSGLQHYSAALRSREGALVNLEASYKPADIYQVVADRVAAKVAVDALLGDPRAILIEKAGVGRSLVKRNVMTFAYSSETFGFRQQLVEDTMKPLAARCLSDPSFTHPYDIAREDTGELDKGFACAGYLATLIWAAVTEVVTKASEGMAFFKAVAAILAHEKLPLVWRSPIGLPVMHKYTTWESKQVKLWLYDRAVPVTEAKSDDKTEGTNTLRRVRANIHTAPTDRIDKDKAKSAVAPNVIHSMDASHLMLTVLEAKDAGVTSLALIHDSFGTHAGKTAELFGLVRLAFVEMYENYDPFQTVLESAQSVLSDEGRAKLPPVPKRGDLDLRRVLDSPYAFA